MAAFCPGPHAVGFDTQVTYYTVFSQKTLANTTREAETVLNSDIFKTKGASARSRLTTLCRVLLFKGWYTDLAQLVWNELEGDGFLHIKGCLLL